MRNGDGISAEAAAPAHACHARENAEPSRGHACGLISMAGIALAKIVEGNDDIFDIVALVLKLRPLLLLLSATAAEIKMKRRWSHRKGSYQRHAELMADSEPGDDNFERKRASLLAVCYDENQAAP